MTESFYGWRVFHPDNWNPEKISARDYTDPPVTDDHMYLIDAENDEGEFDGYLIATATPTTPTITEYWSSRGWLVESKGTWEKLNFSKPKIVEVIEVHNVWAVYGTDIDGTEVEHPVAQFSRPQDWGDPRWHYERFRFEWLTEKKHYINHAHCWTDIKRQLFEYPQLFAPLIVQILMPGALEQFCSREYLKEDDFWIPGWGPQPPYYYPEEEDELIY